MYYIKIIIVLVNEENYINKAIILDIIQYFTPNQIHIIKCYFVFVRMSKLLLKNALVRTLTTLYFESDAFVIMSLHYITYPCSLFVSQPHAPSLSTLSSRS